jgi:hypothetical protein
MSDRGFFDTFKEAGALSRHLADAQKHADNELIRELAHARGTGFGFTSSPTEVEQGTTEALQSAMAILQAKSPADSSAYRDFVLAVAESVAEASKGVAPGETGAIEKIKTAVA